MTPVHRVEGTRDRFNLGLDFKEFTPGQALTFMDFTMGKNVCPTRKNAGTYHLTPQWNTVGGGVQLASCTDLRIAHPSTTFSYPKSKWISTGYGHYLIGKNIGLGRAKQWILQSSRITAESFTLGSHQRCVG